MKLRSTITKIIMSLFLVLTLTVSVAEVPVSAGVSTEAVIADIPGYSNPEKIIISSPYNGYTTTASAISILGASDYRYPITMNGEELETSELGFFTVYCSLNIGENIYTFENNGDIKTITIIRKAAAGGSGTSEQVVYTEYTTAVYGIITSAYAMPRTSIDSANMDCIPITKGTMVRLLGEKGSYYRIYDGTYVAKSSIQKYSGDIGSNKVTAVKMTDDKDNNILTTEITCNLNPAYKVEVFDTYCTLTLYDTTTTPKATWDTNDTVQRIVANIYSATKTVVYTFRFYEDMTICGYDVSFNNNKMTFTLKKVPHLEKSGSLAGAVIVLDAGHGGYETGALGPMGTYGPVEKDINLNITLYARDYLEECGATVVLTRSTDVYMSLSDRVALIRSVQPDISVSVHNNAMGQTSNFALYSGFLTFYTYPFASDAASYINKCMTADIGWSTRTIRRSNLSLTRITACPAFLIENAFMSYPNDYDYLIRTENQQELGMALARAIEDYLDTIAVYKPVDTLYTVKWGDTLSKIAAAYNTTVSVLAEYNGIKNINVIYPGQQIKIPG